MSVKVVDRIELGLNVRPVPYCPRCVAAETKNGEKHCVDCRKEMKKEVSKAWHLFKKHYWDHIYSGKD